MERRNPPNNHPSSPENIPLLNYKFTEEELRAIKECNRESFYYRSVPFSAVFGSLTYYAVQQGFLKPSLKYGAIPKVFGAIGLGYFVGKFSYQEKCQEKIMALPNSRLAEVLRQRKGRGSRPEEMTPEGSYMTVPTESIGKPTSEQYQEMKAQDFTFDAPPTAVGLDDSSRPSVDSVITDDMLPPVQSQSYMSYEDRRKQNREEYDKKKYGVNKPTPPPAPAPFTPPAQFEDSAPTSSMFTEEAAPKSQPSYRKIVKKNEYGDTWEE